MGEVVNLEQITRLDLPPERIINNAPVTELESVVLIGWKGDGDFYFASSIANGPDVLWLMELAKKKLLEVGEDEADVAG